MHNRNAALAAFTVLFTAACSQTPSNDPQSSVMDYPPTRTSAQTDDYHGTQVSDPYRWLEKLDAPEVQHWVEAQNAFSRPYLDELSTRDDYEKRITALWDYEKYKVPYYVNDTLFYAHNDGLQNQYVLWMQEEEDAEPVKLIDPNTFSEDGTVSMASFEVSPKANYVAYMTSDGGSDWKTIHVRETSSGRDMKTTLSGVKFTNIAWLPDESGFYYSRYPQSDDGTWNDEAPVAIFFHTIGEPVVNDEKVFAFDGDRSWNPYPEVIDNGNMLLIDAFEGYEANAVFTLSLTEPNAEVIPLFDKWDGMYSLVGEQDGKLFFKTTQGADTGRVIATRADGSEKQEIVPAMDATLDDVSLVGDKLIAQYIKDVKSQVSVFDTVGNAVSDIELDEVAQVDGFKGSAERPHTFYKITGFTNPGTIYRYNARTGESTLFKRTTTPVDFDNYVTRQVFYTSNDGTKIPMFVVHKKGLKRDGENKTLLYGYGGFNISLLPTYSASRMAWIEQGNILAVANLRGGGEYGQSWHKSGTKHNKQNVFDDFISAANYLIDEQYTSSEKLAIQGGSNGGLLVGATLTQRPGLFGAALPAVGVLDMLRYHTPSANARAWSSDYGLSEDPDMFPSLFAYSPVHNTQPDTCYPATLITTGDHDDRVVPWHSYKFAAQLQRDQSCDSPILLRVETRGGHGAGTPTWMRIEKYADQWAFLEKALN